MQRQIFFMHRSKFVCDAAAAFAKEHKLACYTFYVQEPFGYLVDDLKPTLFYVDLELIKDDLIGFKQELQSIKTSRPDLILLNTKEEDLTKYDLAEFSSIHQGKLDLNELILQAENYEKR